VGRIHVTRRLSTCLLGLRLSRVTVLELRGSLDRRTEFLRRVTEANEVGDVLPVRGAIERQGDDANARSSPRERLGGLPRGLATSVVAVEENEGLTACEEIRKGLKPLPLPSRRAERRPLGTPGEEVHEVALARADHDRGLRLGPKLLETDQPAPSEGLALGCCIFKAPQLEANEPTVGGTRREDE